MKTADERMDEIFGKFSLPEHTWEKYASRFPKAMTVRVYNNLKEMQAEIDKIKKKEDKMLKYGDLTIKHYLPEEIREEVEKKIKQALSKYNINIVFSGMNFITHERDISFEMLFANINCGNTSNQQVSLETPPSTSKQGQNPRFTL